MPDTKLTNLTAASAISGADLFYVVQGGTSLKATGTQLQTWGQTGLATVASTGVYADLSGKPTIPTRANPTASIGLSAVNGSAATFMCSDSAPAIDQTAAYAFSGLGNTTVTGGNYNLVMASGAAAAFSAKITTDTFNRIVYGLDASDLPFVGFGTGTSQRDTFLYRGGVATWQFGKSDTVAPIAQTTTVQSVIAGTTDTAGKDWTLNLSKGTGTGVGGNLIIQGAPHSTTGSTQNALTPILTLNGDTGGATFTPGTGASALTLTGGTVTTSQPVVNATQTWNNSGTTFTGFKLSVTNTASASSSLLVDFQFGGISQLKVQSNGVLTVTNQVVVGTVGNLLGLGPVGDFSLANGGRFAIGPNASVGSSDTFLGRGGIAAWQFGAANAASPVAQTLQAQGSRAGTDSNVAGAGLTIVSGNGTGNSTVSTLTLQSPVAVGSGTGAQTLTTGWRINNGAAASTGYTVATLPATALTGSRAHVTDALTPSFLTAVVGGGATVAPVFYNGSAWVGG